MKIEIYGSGCSKCKQTEKIVRLAVEELDSDATVEKVTDIMVIMEKGVVSTPALVIDGKVVLSGKVPTLEEAKTLIGH